MKPLLLAIALSLALVSPTLACGQPRHGSIELTSECSPTARTATFHIDASGSEPPYRFAYSWDAPSKHTKTLRLGHFSETFTLKRKGTTLYVRWADQKHGEWASVDADLVCEDG